MRWQFPFAMAAIVFISLAPVQPARAAAPVAVSFGTSWDGPTHELQNIVDAYVGVPGAINAAAGYRNTSDERIAAILDRVM